LNFLFQKVIRKTFISKISNKIIIITYLLSILSLSDKILITKVLEKEKAQQKCKLKNPINKVLIKIIVHFLLVIIHLIPNKSTKAIKIKALSSKWLNKKSKCIKHYKKKYKEIKYKSYINPIAIIKRISIIFNAKKTSMIFNLKYRCNFN